MKNTYLLCLLTLLMVFACEKSDEELHPSIVGVWHQDSDAIEGTDWSFRNEMKLNPDGTYERSLQIVETDDVHLIVGYVSLTTGEYLINNNKLELTNIQGYGLDNENQYLDRSELVLLHSTTDEIPEIGFRLEESGSKLTLFYACLDNGSCIPSSVFYRSE